MVSFRIPVALALSLLASSGFAQTRPPARGPVPVIAAPAPPNAAPASTVVPATPQQTTASFADWTLRCNRLGPAPGTQFCEVVQGIQREDRPVAQIAIGRAAKGQSLQLTILVPPNASFAAQPMLQGPKDADGAAIELSWRRCLPGGCTADAALGDDVMRRLRGWTEPARISFLDAAGRAATLPFSSRGLPQALDALAKEEGS